MALNILHSDLEVYILQSFLLRIMQILQRKIKMTKKRVILTHLTPYFNMQVQFLCVCFKSVTHERPQWLLCHTVLSFQDQTLSKCPV